MNEPIKLIIHTIAYVIIMAVLLLLLGSLYGCADMTLAPEEHELYTDNGNVDVTGMWYGEHSAHKVNVISYDRLRLYIEGMKKPLQYEIIFDTLYIYLDLDKTNYLSFTRNKLYLPI